MGSVWHLSFRCRMRASNFRGREVLIPLLVLLAFAAYKAVEKNLD